MRDLIIAGITVLAASAAGCSNGRSEVTDPLAAGEFFEASMSANEDCTRLDASMYLTFQDGWTGFVLTSFDGGDVEMADFAAVTVDADEEALVAGRPWRGTEMHTWTFGEAGAFDARVSFVAVPGSTPLLYQYNATGKIVGGSGRFEGASGQITLHGPFILPMGVPDAGGIIAVKGRVCP